MTPLTNYLLNRFGGRTGEFIWVNPDDPHYDFSVGHRPRCNLFVKLDSVAALAYGNVSYQDFIPRFTFDQGQFSQERIDEAHRRFNEWVDVFVDEALIAAGI